MVFERNTQEYRREREGKVLMNNTLEIEW
jgi:hypothetical protein